MSVIARDTYVDTSWKGLPTHIPTQGGPITKHPTDGGDFFCVGNRALCRAPGLVTYGAVPATADYTVQADVVIFSAIGSAGVGRCDPGATTYYHAYINQGNGELALLKRINGAWTNLESVLSETYMASASGVTYTLALEMTGTTIRVLINGVQKISQTDSAITAKGRGGIRAGIISNVGTGKHLDNFLLTDTSTTPAGRSFSPGPLGI